MAENKKEVRCFEIDMSCPECGKGKMRPTGLVYASAPYQYQHRCNECGWQTAYTTTYPHIEYGSMNIEEAIGHIETGRRDCDTCPEYDHENHRCPKFCDVIEDLKRQDSCETCLRQGCQYKDGTARMNCPLWRGSAV